MIKHGVGIAGHSFGVGGAGDGGKMAVQLDPDDGITIFAAVADPGEGNDALLLRLRRIKSVCHSKKYGYTLGIPLKQSILGLQPAAG